MAWRHLVIAAPPAPAALREEVVDAIDQAAERFYQHFGFTPTPREMRLVRKVSDIEADIKN
jgi:hypothetical protein